MMNKTIKQYKNIAIAQDNHIRNLERKVKKLLELMDKKRSLKTLEEQKYCEELISIIEIDLEMIIKEGYLHHNKSYEVWAEEYKEKNKYIFFYD